MLLARGRELLAQREDTGEETRGPASCALMVVLVLALVVVRGLVMPRRRRRRRRRRRGRHLRGDEL
jgi:hypothetical protein